MDCKSASTLTHTATGQGELFKQINCLKTGGARSCSIKAALQLVDEALQSQILDPVTPLPSTSVGGKCNMQRGTARTAAARLRREHGVMGGVPVLLSTEKPRCQLVSMVDMEEGNPLDYQVMTS